MQRALPLSDDTQAALMQSLSGSDLEATIELELSGDKAGSYYLRVGEGVEVVPETKPVDIIVRTDLGTLEAVLAGRTTLADVIIAERLSLLGDATKIMLLKSTIDTLSA